MKLVAPAFSLKKSAQGVLHFSASGDLLAQVTSRVVIWDVPNRKELCSIKAMPNEHFVAFHEPTHRLAIKSSNGELAFVDLRTEGVVAATGKFKEFRMGCQPWFTEEGEFLLDGGSGGKLTLWNVANARAEKQWDLGSSTVVDIAFSPARRLYACLYNPAGCCQLALLGGDLTGASPTLLSPSDFGIDPSQWWEAGHLAFSPCGARLALVAKTQARENRHRLFVLDVHKPALIHSLEIGDDYAGWATSLSWSDDDHIALVYHENPWRQGMSTPEYEALKNTRVWESVQVLAAHSGETLQKVYLPGVNRATFRPASNGLAVNCTQFPGAYLPGFEDLPGFAKGKNR